MDKKNEKARDKALKKWKKKHPDKPIEEFIYGNDSSIMDISNSNAFGDHSLISGGNINASEYRNNHSFDYR